MSRRRRVRERLRCRSPLLPCCSSARHTAARLLPSTLQRRTARGRCARDASAIDAVGDSPQDIFHFPGAEIGVQLVEGALASQRAVGSAQPFHGLFLVADHFHRGGVDPRQTHSAVRLSSTQAGMLTQAACQCPLRNAELPGKRGVAEIELLRQRDHRACRQSLANQFGKVGYTLDCAAQHLFPAQHFRNVLRRHVASWLLRLRHLARGLQDTSHGPPTSPVSHARYASLPSSIANSTHSGSSYGCSSLKAACKRAVYSAMVLINSRYSSSCSTFSFQRYTERIGPTMLTQAATRRSTSCPASFSASSFEPIVVSTMRAFAMLPSGRKW